MGFMFTILVIARVQCGGYALFCIGNNSFNKTIVLCICNDNELSMCDGCEKNIIYVISVNE
jgi:hypothetical protein